MSARISADRLHTLHMKAVDAAKELTCEIEFALEVVRDGSIVDGNLSRRITEWNESLTQLAIGVHGEARIPGGGLDWAPEEIELRRAEETQIEANFAAYVRAQEELVATEREAIAKQQEVAAKQQEVAELAATLGLGDLPTRVEGSLAVTHAGASSDANSLAPPIFSSAAPVTKPRTVSAVVALTVATAPSATQFSSAARVKKERRECDVCRSRKGLQDFAEGARCKQCYSDEMTVRRVNETLLSFGVKPLGERSRGETVALARMRKDCEGAKYALLARRQSSSSVPPVLRK